MIDPNEAPSGMVAVSYTGCHNCVLHMRALCASTPCATDAREDGQNVMFIKVSTSQAISNQAPAYVPQPPAAPVPVPDDKKHIPSAGMCAECSKHVPDKCSALPFSTMDVIRTLPAHKLVVVRCTNFER